MSSLGVQRVVKFLILAMTFVVPVLADEKAEARTAQSTVSASTSAAEPSITAEPASATADLAAAEPAVAEPGVAQSGDADTPATEPANSPAAAPAATSAAAATATADTSSAANPDKKLYVDIYPVFGWIPFFSANFTVPPLPGGGGGNSVGGSTSLKINGALAFAVDVRYSKWLFEGEGMFASVGAQRQTPYVDASTRLNYWDMFLGYDVWKGIYPVVGFRRISVDFKATVLNSPTFARSPGLNDPMIGVEWRKQLGHKFNVQARYDVGGFGVGSYLDTDLQFRAEWRFAKHFGALLGYQLLYDKLTGTVNETILNTTVTHNWSYAQTFHGPILGFGIYF